MPELPEVETVKRTLETKIIDEEIINVELFHLPLIENVEPSQFINKLINQKIRKIERYGKYLIFILDTVSIISHLRMEGKFFLKDKEEERNIHEHAIFTFKSGLTLRYHDTRKFGKMALVNTTKLDEIMEYKALKKLGPEANSDNLTENYLYEKLTKKKDPIKTALLNQEILAGLGNIYADEVCFLCKLHPLMPCNKLTKTDVLNIIKYSKYVLEGAIKAGGTTIRSYTSSLGVTGRFQLCLHVHTKENEPCENCGSIIKKIFVGGRGTYYCEVCQKNRRPKVVGITGGIASGKSTVTKYLRSIGYPVLDSDEIVRKLYSRNSVIEKVREVFSSEYIVDNKIDRVKLGKLIFNNKEEKEKLNSIVHPLVKKELINGINDAITNIVFLDIPLLYEAKFEDLCDYVIVVNVDKETNILRLMERDGIDREYAISKINAQMSIDEKCHKADFIIDNSKDLCYTYMQTTKIVKMLEE